MNSPFLTHIHIASRARLSNASEIPFEIALEMTEGDSLLGEENDSLPLPLLSFSNMNVLLYIALSESNTQRTRNSRHINSHTSGVNLCSEQLAACR